jgi:L-asparaginase II
MNCSGKHAAMLATCVANGWPTDGYLSLDHPVQTAITATIAGWPASRSSGSPSTAAARRSTP